MTVHPSVPGPHEGAENGETPARAPAPKADVMPLRLKRLKAAGERGERHAGDLVAEPKTRPGLPQRGAGRRATPLKLVDRAAPVAGLVRRAERRVSGVFLSFLAMVALPTLVALLYFMMWASPLYVSEFRFSVRPLDPASATASNPLLAFTDNYIVADYVRSRDVVDALQADVDLRGHYGADDVDWLSRFHPDGSTEDLVTYWSGRVEGYFDMTTGINQVEVRAFSPEDAQRIALALKALCDDLVNAISDQARKKQLEYAESQLKRAEQRLTDVREKETAFRATSQTLDAGKVADAKIELAAKIRGELVDLQTEFDAISAYLDDTSPRKRVLMNQIEAAEARLSSLDGEVVKGDPQPGGLSSAQALAEYEKIQVERELATKLYESALGAYEQARLMAITNQVYLATYVQPTLPEEASFPQAPKDTFLVFLALLGIWVTLTLIYYSVRDHAA